MEWLNSHAGVMWSRERHWQSCYAFRMFTIKDDAATSQELRSDRKNEYWRSWGRVDVLGRYRRPAKHSFKHRPYFNLYTPRLAEIAEETTWYDQYGESITEWDQNGEPIPEDENEQCSQA